jgi:hypothetical protein
MLPANTPAQQMAALERLKYMIGQTPWRASGPEIELTATEVMPPRVIEMKSVRAEHMYLSIMHRLTLLRTELEILELAKMAVPEPVREQIGRLIVDVAALAGEM